MYKILKIGSDDYKFEFSIEASLYGDCIEKITGLMFNVEMGQGVDTRQYLLSGIADIPSTAATCFYAGLLEHHGTESGDGKVPNLNAAKRLVVKLLKDEESEYENWYDILNLCMEQMGEDGFFDLVGLGDLLGSQRSNTKKTTKKKTPKVVEASET